MVKKTRKADQKEKTFLGAIDLGGTKIGSALFTSGGRPAFRAKVLVDSRGGQEVVEQIILLYYQLEAEARAKKGRLLAVGLGVPGVVKPGSGLVWAPNIKGWKNLQLLKCLKKEIKCPISVVSDRTAYLLGEAWKGAAKGRRNIIYLAVGTGIGAGIMAEGQVIHGEGDLAGAVGWMALNRDFKRGYRQVGCFEWEASGRALARKARLFIKSCPETFISSGKDSGSDKNEVEIVCQAARRGQSEAVKLVEEIQDYLAMGVANLISAFNPEVVILGGGLFQSPDLFFEPLQKKFRRWAQPLAASSVKLVLSALGQEAALYGCARSAWLGIQEKMARKGQG
ncbi:MAG: ROK family protein [Acidobacteriota bacterium]|nr:ROK family protein [Acidobacteriota bacterium]MDW3229562.1 ROK family protein [Acidobacteriota bacterium]MDY0231721.1 ROK family protein [Candidatus Saccharicenans sp.]